MKLPNLKIPTKDLPLFALGITAVLVASVFGQSLIGYLLTAIFFGILSEEARWKYWGSVFLIDVFISVKFLLRTDGGIIAADVLWQLGRGINNIFVSNTSVVSDSWISRAMNTVVEQCTSNPIYINPVIMRIISTVLILLGGFFWVLSVILLAGYIIALLPIVGHTILMLYIFHRNELISIIELDFVNETVPEYMGKLIAPYLMQGVVIQVLLATAILPLIFYRVLKRVGFYKRIPNI